MTNQTFQDRQRLILEDFFDRLDQLNERSDYTWDDCFKSAQALLNNLILEAIGKDEIGYKNTRGEWIKAENAYQHERNQLRKEIRKALGVSDE